MTINLGDSEIGVYRIDELLSTTTNSSLYRASAPGQPDGVVLRTLSREAAPKPSERQHFLDEIQALTDLRSKYVLSAFDSGVTKDDRPYVVLEDADRGSLHDRLSSGYVPTGNDIDHLVEFLSGAIEDLQPRGLTIGEIEPGNVLIRSSLQRSSVGQGLLSDDERYVLSEISLRPTDSHHQLSHDPAEDGAVLSDAHPPFNQDQVRTDLTSASMLIAEVVCGSKPSATTSWTTHLKNESRFPELDEALAKSLAENQEDHPGSVGLWSESLLNRPSPPMATRVRRELSVLGKRVNRRQGQLALMIGAFAAAAVFAVVLASWLIGGERADEALPSGPAVSASPTTSSDENPPTTPTTDFSVAVSQSGNGGIQPSTTLPPVTSKIETPPTTAPSSASTTPPETNTEDETTSTETTSSAQDTSATTEPTDTTPPTEQTVPATEATVPATEPSAPTTEATDPTVPTTEEEQPDVPPQPPSELRVLSATSNSVTVGWSSAPGSVGYQMANQKTPEEKLAADKTSHTFTGNIGPGRNYLFEVATVGTNNRISSYAAVLAKTPGVDPNNKNASMNPSGVTASSTANSISVSWQNVEGNAGYVVFRDHSRQQVGVETDRTGVTFSGLEPDRAYLVEVRTQVPGGNESSERVPIVVRTKR